MSIQIIQGDCRAVLPTLAAGSVQCVVTSPPYFGLRDYGTATWDGGDPACDHISGMARGDTERETPGGKGGSFRGGVVQFRDTCGKCGATRVDAQLGLEASPDLFIAEMVAVFRLVWRVLRDDGVLFLNLGDSYSGGPSHAHEGMAALGAQYRGGGHKLTATSQPQRRQTGAKPKDLLMMPARVAIALQADGWFLRSDIIWHKPNPMPESVTDRPTTSHEHVFLLTKKPKYFYDADSVREPNSEGSIDRFGIGENGQTRKWETSNNKRDGRGDGTKSSEGFRDHVPVGRNLRNVWTIATHAYPDAHFATFPPELAERCIKAGTSEKGCCPACGAPWGRTVTKGEPDTAHRAASGADSTGGYNGQSTKNHDAHGVQNASDVKRRILEGMRLKTYGWQPTCDCPPADPVPCVVLDPFSGAGTTALVADRLGRRAIGIELNPAYATLARDRVYDDAPLFADVS